MGSTWPIARLVTAATLAMQDLSEASWVSKAKTVASSQALPAAQETLLLCCHRYPTSSPQPTVAGFDVTGSSTVALPVSGSGS